MIDIDELQQEILEAENTTRLYEIQIDLSKLIKNVHQQIIMAETTMEQSEAKGNLGIYHSMLSVLQNRISEIKELERAEKDSNNRINYNFRMASKSVLKKETYNQIMDLAQKTRHEVKANRKELRANRLQ